VRAVPIDVLGNPTFPYSSDLRTTKSTLPHAPGPCLLLRYLGVLAASGERCYPHDFKTL